MTDFTLEPVTEEELPFDPITHEPVGSTLVSLEKENPTANTSYLEALDKENSLTSPTPNVPKVLSHRHI